MEDGGLRADSFPKARLDRLDRFARVGDKEELLLGVFFEEVGEPVELRLERFFLVAGERGEVGDPLRKGVEDEATIAEAPGRAGR